MQVVSFLRWLIYDEAIEVLEGVDSEGERIANLFLELFDAPYDPDKLRKFGLTDDHILRSKEIYDNPPQCHLSRVFNKNWLNDTCVNDHIAHQLKGKKDFCYLDPITDLEKVKNLCSPLKVKKLFGEKKMLFAPLHVTGSHWTLLAVDLTKRKFHYYDSLHWQVPVAAIENIRQHLVKIAKQEKVAVAKGDFALIREDCPQQDNASDCALHVLMTVDQLTRNKPLNHSPSDAAYFRLKVVTDLTWI